MKLLRLIGSRVLTLMAVAIGLVLFTRAGEAAPPFADHGSLVALKRAVLTNYATIVAANYRDAVVGARLLQSAVETFLQEPSEEGLQMARAAWLASRVPYLQTEACRFYEGPIDQVEGSINAWPIDENYIDYVVDHPQTGIINATVEFPTLSRELLLSLNEKEGKKNICTGFHAIEFLLWGQDLSPTGPGNRSWHDYTDGAKNADRRRQYLHLVTELLVKQLETVVEAWVDAPADNYRTQFLTMESDAALGLILKGVGAFSGPELSGERLTAAYETKEQEDEHSCFSDSTCQDLIYDAIGLQNIYLGRYVDLGGHTWKGPGLHDLLREVDSEFAGKLEAQVAAGVAAARAIPAPFDQAILGAQGAPGREAIKQSLVAFQNQSDLLAKTGTLLSIKINL